jgi:hypothetical protein
MRSIPYVASFVVAGLIALAAPATAKAQVAAPTRQVQPPPPPVESYTLGVGGRAGGLTFGIGASLRSWFSPKLGVDVQISRFDQGGFGYSVGITQLGAAALYRVSDGSTDSDVVLRPYVGGGLNVFMASTSARAFGFATSESDSAMGLQIVGGTEIVFRDAPKFVLSADLGYYTTGHLFDEISLAGMAFGLSGHWYVK